MPRPASWMSCVFPSLEHSTRRVRNLQTMGGHTPGTVQTWKDTAFDAGRGTEELPGFYSKEFAAAGYIWNVMVPSFFVYSLSPVHFPGCWGLSNTALPF